MKMMGQEKILMQPPKQNLKRPRYQSVYDDLREEIRQARWAIPGRPSQAVTRLAEHIHRIDDLVDELPTALWLDDERKESQGKPE
jgi:hypothetical protein